MNGAHSAGEGAIVEELRFWVNVLASLSAVALAVFAGVEIWRGRKVTARADAEVSANAYTVRRHLRMALGESWDSRPTLLNVRALEYARGHMANAEPGALAMIAAAGGASERLASPARRAFVLFYQGQDKLTAIQARGTTADSDEARQTLQDSIAHLDLIVSASLD